MINCIITKRLMLSKDEEDVIEAMNSLAEMMRCQNDNYAENRKIAFRRGAHLAVVFAMRQNENSDDLQGYGLDVLTQFSCCKIESTSIKPDILAVGGLKCCISAMGRHSNNANVQESGCRLINNLWNYLTSTELRKKVVGQGGIKAVVNAMDNLERNGAVQRIGCKALYSLLRQDSSWSTAVVDAG
jgi:hypothetical protein